MNLDLSDPRCTGARLEDRLYEHLDWRVPPRPHAHEELGDQMIQAGLDMGPNTPYGESTQANKVVSFPIHD